MIKKLYKKLQKMLHKPGTVRITCKDGEFWIAKFDILKKSVPRLFKD